MRRHLLCALVVAAFSASVSAESGVELVGRAILPADSFTRGPTSGQHIGGGANGVSAPFVRRQPVQGFSAILKDRRGAFLVMSDNGFGSLENSADYNLRVHRIEPDFKTRDGGRGTIRVRDFIQLHDPYRKIPFAITNHFSKRRVLTGADFDLESMQRAPDGTLWFGDEFGPFLIHTDDEGRVLEAPIALPDFSAGQGELRSPQNPLNEESAAIRIMNAVRAHAAGYRARTDVVFSPSHVMLDDGNPDTFVESRKTPPGGSGLAPASSEVFTVRSIKSAGYAVVPYTINDKPRMLELLKLGVNGIISDRPDLLLEAAREFDADGDGKPGDFVGADGLIDITKFDAQGHRGARNLRPENTLPAMEAALDNLVTTLETDTGVSKDKVSMLDHDPQIEATKCRRADGEPYTAADQALIRDLTRAQIQSTFICDKLFRGPSQTNARGLSPVAVAFAAQQRLIDP